VEVVEGAEKERRSGKEKIAALHQEGPRWIVGEQDGVKRNILVLLFEQRRRFVEDILSRVVNGVQIFYV